MIRKLKRALTARRATRDMVHLFTEETVPEREESRIRAWPQRSADYRENFVATAHLIADLNVLAGDKELSSLTRTGNDSEYSGRRQCAEVVRLSAGAGSKADVKRTFTAGNRYWPGLAIVATVLLAVATLVYTLHSPVNPDIGARYVTRIGEQKTVELKDGSTVTLNTNTELIVTFTAEERRLTLTRGEAYFKAQADPDRPFTVGMGEHGITVLGTQFNIYKHSTGIKLAVTEGTVLWHRMADSISSTASVLAPPKGETIHLNAALPCKVTSGTVVELNSNNNSLAAYHTEQLGNIVSWQKGVLQFTAAPMRSVVAELNRYSAKPISIGDAAAEKIELFATIRLDRINEALAIFAESMPIQIDNYPDRIVIRSKKHGEN